MNLSTAHNVFVVIDFTSVRGPPSAVRRDPRQTNDHTFSIDSPHIFRLEFILYMTCFPVNERASSFSLSFWVSLGDVSNESPFAHQVFNTDY